MSGTHLQQIQVPKDNKKMKVSKENAEITWVTRDDGIDE